MGSSEQYRYTGTTFNEGWGVERIMAKLSKEELRKFRERTDWQWAQADKQAILDHIAAMEQEQERTWYWVQKGEGYYYAQRNIGIITEYFSTDGQWHKWEHGSPHYPNDASFASFPTIAALTAAVEAAEERFEGVK